MSEQLRTVATFSTAAQAHFFADRLRDAGIFAAIADEHVVTTDYLLAGAVAGIKVQVREPDLERAEAILATPVQIAEDEIPWKEGVDESDNDDPDLDRQHLPDESDVPPIEGEQLVDRAYRSAIIGLMLFLLAVFNIFSMILLLRVAFHHGGLPPRANSRYHFAFILNCVAIGVAGWVWSQIGAPADGD